MTRLWIDKARADKEIGEQIPLAPVWHKIRKAGQIKDLPGIGRRVLVEFFETPEGMSLPFRAYARQTRNGRSGHVTFHLERYGREVSVVLINRWIAAPLKPIYAEGEKA